MKISLSILFLILCTFAIAQQEMMINGGFETVVNSVTPYPGSDFAIEYAPPWRSVYATVDIDHPNAPLNLGGIPYEGEGVMRIAYKQQSQQGEYAQGKTLDLVAGTTYEISFMAQVRFSSPVHIRNFGMMISTTEYNNSNFNPETDFDPQLLVSVGTSWVTGSYCYTAQTSGAHYVVLGGTCDPTPDGAAMFINVDNVSVKTIPNNSGVPIANIADNQTEFCIDNIVLDGSGSSNETGHHWIIEQRLPTGDYICLYNQSHQNGQAGLFNVNNAFASISHNPGYGSCYRAYLYTSNDCEVRDKLEFCIVNPNVFFITDGSPVCENIPRDLQVTGDNGWTYTWSTGQSGIGLKTITVTPTIGNSTYTVIVTTPEGCTSTKTITLVVNSQNNVAPWMDGINGTGEYTYYVRQNDAVFFNSVVFNDHLSEQIQYSAISNTVPSGHIATPPSSLGGIFSFSWVTTLNTPVGEYHYVLRVDDQNSCIAGIDTFDFRIIVICDQCLVCVGHENRTPGSNPLPPETKAGKCIEAGMSQTVSTGDANVIFQAGVSITEGPYFDAGPGYEAIIDPTTCITDCEDCCSDWDGFHMDNPYYTIINFWDNDPTNDRFELTDFDHPFCSYGSKRFDMYIDDADDGSNYAHFSGGGDQCCMLQTRTPENPIPHSSIFWDGYLGGGYASKQYYRIQVVLYDCVNLPHDFWFMVSVTSLGSQLAQNNSDSALPMENTLSLDSATETDRLISDSTANSNEELGIYPNPATNMLYISGSRSETTTIQLYDEKGKALTKREKVALNQGYNLDAFSAGTYYCRIYKNDGSYVLKQFIKL